MARGITDSRPHRANGEVGLHVLAVMDGILEAATGGRRVAIEQHCERPPILDEDEARIAAGLSLGQNPRRAFIPPSPRAGSADAAPARSS